MEKRIKEWKEDGLNERLKEDGLKETSFIFNIFGFNG